MTNTETVKQYLDSFYREKKEYEKIEQLLTEDFKFVGPMATFDGRKSFMKFIREIGPQKNTIQINKVIAEGDDVAVFHDYSSKTPVIGPLPFAEHYTLRDGKISSLQLYFDAREFSALIDR